MKSTIATTTTGTRWKLPPCLDGQWLLAQLRGIADGAGPEAVMSGLVAAYGVESKTTKTSKSRTQLRLFDPQNKMPAN